MESAVFKYPTNNLGSITLDSSLTLATTNYRPAILTAADDDTAGASLTNIWTHYTGNPHGKYYGSSAGALILNSGMNVSLNNLRMCYLSQAISCDANGGATITISHAQLIDCIAGININGSGSGSGGSGGTVGFSANNCLIANVGTFFAADNADVSGTAYNCTLDSVSNLFSMAYVTGSFEFTNCILTGVQSMGVYSPLFVSGG